MIRGVGPINSEESSRFLAGVTRGFLLELKTQKISGGVAYRKGRGLEKGEEPMYGGV